MKLIKIAWLLLLCQAVNAQGTLQDYQRTKELKTKISNKVYNIPQSINWNKEGNLFWYEKPLKNKQREYVLVDPSSKKREELISLEALSAALNKELNKPVSIQSLSGRQLKIIDPKTLEITAEGSVWQWDRISGAIKKIKNSEERATTDNSYWGRRWDGRRSGPSPSPDKQYTAFIKNNNVFITHTGNEGVEKQVTFDGTEEDYYSSVISWSPDSKKITTSRISKAPVRQLTLIQSSPADQLQPKILTRDYAKPGDTLSQYYPIIYNIETSQLYTVNPELIQNQFSISRQEWRSDSRSVTFEYNKRGHQQYSVLELDATNGKTQVLIDERSPTFIDYSGKKYRKDIQDGKEIIWASERDGWNHLYLFDGITGKLKNQITKGQWVVRSVTYVDEKKRKIIFQASGMNKNEDPYLIHYYQIDFNGKNLKALTPEVANHQAYFNADFSKLVDIFSLADQAPKMVLRDASGNKLMDLEEGDITDLLATGWKKPEVFTAKGRDGVTDIWGVIIRPTNFDSSKKYPVIENIYAGPQGAFVPKSFSTNPGGMYELAELGFIVVQIDGMGTSYRSKSFQDVAWKNLKDAGFPDRILWMKAAAAKYPYMDLDRVGIYGTSAGGQSSTGALLFHPEFYKVAVSSCGCHDNRMDKIWWNEQWMGWPIGPHYAECSNVENASRLKGKLMLMVGEIDDNVDPSSTYQLVNTLIKNNKDHELIVLPGLGHTAGGDYGEKKRRDFFVKNLLGVNPPAWTMY